MMLYLLLFIASLWLVMSTRINTNNTLKLVGIGCIAIGSLAGLDGHSSNLVEIGILIYFASNILAAYFGKRKRRYYDKVANG